MNPVSNLISGHAHGILEKEQVRGEIVRLVLNLVLSTEGYLSKWRWPQKYDLGVTGLLKRYALSSHLKSLVICCEIFIS